MDLPWYAVVWADPHGGVGSVPRCPDGSPDYAYTLEKAVEEAQILADLSPAMVVMVVQDPKIFR